MNQYVISSLIAFVLVGMGLTAFILGVINYRSTGRTLVGAFMWNVCWCVFFWNFGYAWMSLCYDSDVAYFARAIALLAVTVYMMYIIRYVAEITDYSRRKEQIFLLGFTIASLIAWTQIIQKKAVTFVTTPWGYWYRSDMSWARMVQFASILAALCQYYVILRYGWKKATKERERYVLKKYCLFGPILFTGYILDTLVPSIFHTAAIPGSCISAFISAMVLFQISTNHKMFGLTKEHVSEYVFRDVRVPVLIADSEGKIVMCNDITYENLGVTHQELEENGLDILFDGRQDDIVSIKNKEMVCNLEQTDVKDEFGDLMYSIYFLHDITQERKNLREAKASQRMAENANKAKSDFLANMSHEIRTPINAVLGMDELIIRECEDEKILGYAGNIKDAGTLLLSLINDILDFSKIENGKMDIVPATYDTPSLIHDLYVMSYDRARKKNLDLEFEIDSNIPAEMYGDDVRLRQIIMNLLTNAIKYTREGQVSFALSLKGKHDGMVKLRVSVKDTGIGIRQEDIDKMFSAFQRVDEDINRNIEGTGLGLSITMSLLKLMNTELKLESIYGEGSEFYFDLEQKIINEAPIGDMSEIIRSSEMTRKKYKESFHAPEAKILVVDDNEMNLQIVKALLKQTGIQITTALSGQASIELVKTNTYDVIFMDYMMPEMDGIETVKRIRKLSHNESANATIIALTANAIHGAREMFLGNGFDDFMSKPVKGEKLEEILIQYLPKELVMKSDSSNDVEIDATVLENHEKPKKSLKQFLQTTLKINMQDGLKYCMEDQDLYEEIVGLYASNNEVEALNTLYSEKNWKEYTVKIHAVKSNSKNIGANDLFELALALEMAAREENVEYIDNNHDSFMKEYQTLIDEIGDVIR
ncbi:MAG: ATP-binding protein [Eubacteriales bacterium]|nr:ATP-binding protein [Eubacteriales bacterium]